jgi:cell division septal protein FtsQ
MSERRIRVTGRQVYGRAMPLKRPGRLRVRRPQLSLLQRRLILLAVLMVAGGWALLRLFAITTVTVKSPGRGVEIKAEVGKLLDESWQQRNLLTLDDGQLESKLQQADPLLRSVEVRRRWFHGVVVTAVLKQPSLGWSTGNQRYLLDRDGTAIGVLASSSTLPIVVDGSNLPVQIGQRVTTSHFVAFATGLVPALSANGVGVRGLSVKDTTLDLTATTNKGYRLVFDTGRGVEEEMADLKSVQTLLASQKRTPAEYIDVRIAGRAYYK